MEAFLYVLVMSFSQPSDWVYQGHFKSCEYASQYIKQNFQDVKEYSSRCLLEEYIVLPKNTRKRIVDLQPICKFKRNCNEKN
tara:strand:- start:315 stop:560 length:246 start_codon:yes stop_codon:yes gene_type:complete